MKASIIVQLTLGEEVYNIDLSLPSSSPTADKPFQFGVSNVQKDKLLQVAIGEGKQFYVAVKPPASLLDAASSSTVTDLKVEVSEGDFNGKTFTSTAAITDKTDDKGDPAKTDTPVDPDKPVPPTE